MITESCICSLFWGSTKISKRSLSYEDNDIFNSGNRCKHNGDYKEAFKVYWLYCWVWFNAVKMHLDLKLLILVQIAYMILIYLLNI